MSDRLSKLEDRLRQAGIEHLLLCSAEPALFLRLFLPHRNGTFSVHTIVRCAALGLRPTASFFLADMERAEEVPGVESEAFLSYTMERPLGAMEDLAARIVARMGRVGSGQVGIEADHLPVALLERLRFACPGLKVHDITPLLSEIRMIHDKGCRRRSRAFAERWHCAT